MLFGLDESQIERIKKLLRDYESGRLFNVPVGTSKQSYALATYLAVTTSSVSAESSGTLGSGTADVYGIDSSDEVTNQKIGITVYNLTTDSIDSATNVLVVRDPISGKYLIARTENSSNTDQDLWSTINADSGSTSADSTSDTLTVSGGTGIGTSISGDTLTVNCDLPTWATITCDGSDASPANVSDGLTLSGESPISTAGDGSQEITVSVADASQSSSGVVNTSAQSFLGVKTFVNDVFGGKIKLQATGSPSASASIEERTESLHLYTQTNTEDIELILTAQTPPSFKINTDSTDYPSVILGNDGGSVSGANLTEAFGLTTVSGLVTAGSEFGSMGGFTPESGDKIIAYDADGGGGGTGAFDTIDWDDITAAASGDPDQNLWSTISADTGSTSANSTTDTLTVAGGTDISTSISGDTLTINYTGTAGDPDQDLWLTINGDTGSQAATTATDTLTVAGGTGITTVMSGSTLTISTDGQPDQDLWDTIQSDSGSTTANSTTDTLTVTGAGGIETSISSDTLTIDGSSIAGGLVCNGRLTCSSGDPNPVSVSTSTSIYWTPFEGNRVSIYNVGQAKWETLTFSSEVSYALGTLSSNTNYDVFFI